MHQKNILCAHKINFGCIEPKISIRWNCVTLSLLYLFCCTFGVIFHFFIAPFSWAFILKDDKPYNLEELFKSTREYDTYSSRVIDFQIGCLLLTKGITNCFFCNPYIDVCNPYTVFCSLNNHVISLSW